MTGLYWRGQKNTERIAIRHNYIEREDVPSKFEGFTILQLSDLHADMNPGPMRRLVELLGEVKYDVCVLTGDYRGETFGPFDAALEGVALVRSHLKEPVYGVLGNHDTIRMVPGLEEMGIRMLLNESETITLDGQRIHLAGIDDAHYYRADNIQNAASKIPHDEFSILLSHTPEIYRQAAHADFKLLLSGHTHGGQVCLPGSIPITLDSVLPRHMGSRAVEVSQYGGLHVGWRRVDQLLRSASTALRRLRCITCNARHRFRGASRDDREGGSGRAGGKEAAHRQRRSQSPRQYPGPSTAMRSGRREAETETPEPGRGRSPCRPRGD